MFPGINPKKMQAVMKQMGMSQQEIPSSKVIIKQTNGDEIIIANPSVTKINMQGQESFQIIGNIQEQNKEQSISEEDIKTIIEKTGCTKEKAEETLRQTNDLAEAILQLSE